MERLYALALLWAYGFCSKEQFNSVLDEIFLSDKGADRDILLELEQCSGSDRDTLHRLFHYFTYEVPPEDVDLFGKTFFSNLSMMRKRIDDDFEENTPKS